MVSKVYEIITNEVIKALEKGKIPWHKPWSSVSGLPKNLVSKKTYRGINVFWLNFQDFKSPYWLSFKQVQELGGRVKKGEKSTMVFYYKWIEKKTGNKITNDAGKKVDEIEEYPIFRYFNVFSVNQTTGLEDKIPKDDIKKPEDFNPIDEAEKIVNGYKEKPEIKHGYTHAAYNPRDDTIELPDKEDFDGEIEYYSTSFHEMIHSTKHKKRLNRANGDEDKMKRFGDEDYSKEELVAEMGAQYLCNEAGIQNKIKKNSTAYISHWLKKLKEDKKILVQAATKSQQATDYILTGKKFEK